MTYSLDEPIRLLASATLVLAVACGHSAESGSSATPGGAGGQSASAAGGSGGGAAGGSSTLDCTGIVPLASAEELAAPPRPDADAEWLAVEAGDSFLADEAIYARAHRDLAALRSAHPAFAGSHVYGEADGLGHVIAVELTDAAFALAMAGEWHGWDCLNAAYGAEAPAPWSKHGHPPIFSVPLPDRRARHDLLAAQYAELPDVTASFPWGTAGDFPDVCLSIEGDAYAYVFVEPSGLDHCDAVCPHHRFTGFRVDAAGAVEELGVYEVDSATKPRPSAPAWLSGLGACTRWLPACHWGMCD
jgi:hypothetical protein